MALDDPATITAIVLVVIVACGIVVYAMRKRGKKKKALEKPELESELRGLPFKISKSVQSTDASQAKDELRILDLEREILSDAIRRLYEAHAEGKITEEERERLAGTYKTRMMTVKEAMSKDETIVALHELESMREDLMKLFSERFGELTSKVEELRSKIEVKPIREIKVQMPALEEAEKAEEEEGEEKPKKKRKPPEKPSPKTEAEKRIEEIRSEVEKVLDRLGQMEIET
jgi:translation initiation factor IF-2